MAPLRDRRAAERDPAGSALDQAFAREARLGVLLTAGCWAIYGLMLAASQVQNLLTVSRNLPRLYDASNILLLIELAVVPMAALNAVLAARSRRPMLWCYLFMALNMLLLSELSWAWLWSPPGFDQVPPVIGLRYQGLVLVAAFCAIYALPLSSRLAWIAGAAAFAVSLVGLIVSAMRFKSTVVFAGAFGPGFGQAGLIRIMRPEVLVLDHAVIGFWLLGLFIIFIAMACREGRRYVIAGVEAEAERNFLRRFFAPDVAERIASAGGAPIAPARRQVAILFVEIGKPGFDATDLGALQAAYARLEAVVFAHGGVLDRFAGGPAMAAFGAVDADPGAAATALACGRALAAAGPVRMAAHAGQAVCGEIVGGRTRTFSVVGDVVNTARRVLDEAISRSITLLATEALVAAAPAQATSGLDELGEVTLRGREAPVRLWSLA